MSRTTRSAPRAGADAKVIMFGAVNVAFVASTPFTVTNGEP